MSLNELPWMEINLSAPKYDLDPDWLAALIINESSGNQYAIRYEPAFKYLYTPRIYSEKLGITVETEEFSQKTSWSYTQIMGAVARELGFQGHLPQLIEPAINIDLCCKKLQNLRVKYSDIMSVMSAYNQGSPRKTDGGMFVNQKYVDRFDMWLRRIKEGH